MIRTDLLRGKIAERGLSQFAVAKALGITPQAFYGKMKRGVFRSDEMQLMIDLLDIENPCEIFFAKEVESQGTSQNRNTFPWGVLVR